MARIPDEVIEQLKRNISVADLCRSRGIDLNKHGRKDLVGKCPFHPEHKDSFVVSPEKNLWHCMGCDAAGSVIDLVMKLDGLAFREAADKLLASHPHLDRAPQPKKKPTVPADVSRRNAVKPERANQLLERVVSIYEKNLADSDDGKHYLAHRGIEDAGLLTVHRVGYCNGRLKGILPGNGQVLDDLNALGVLADDHSEHFAGCLVFPVYDVDGNLVTLYGRYTNDGLKRHVFLPDRPTGLWNVAAIKTYSEIILVESVLDALSLMVAGFGNVVSIQGTNGLRGSDVALLAEHGVSKLTLLLDGDEAGQKAAKRLKEKLLSSFSCDVRVLPGDHDPNSYLKEHGAEALSKMLSCEPGASTDGMRADVPVGPPASPKNYAGTSPASPTLTLGRRKYEVHGLDRSARKLKATVRVEHAGRLHVDTLDLYSARARRTLAQDLCRLFEEPAETIEADITKLLKHCENLPEKPEGGAAAVTPEQVITDADRTEAETFGKSPDLVEQILADMKTRGLIGEEPNKLLTYLAITSRKMEEPISVLTLSSSGAGKTALQDAALAFCPPEDVVKLTALSGKALFYKEQMSLKHKILALEEGAGVEEALYAIRNLISQGFLTSEATIKDPATGKLTTMTNRVDGPSSVLLTTTNPEIDPETRSRFFVTAVDESRAQTRAILAFQRKRETLEGLAGNTRLDALTRKHHNFQRLLKPVRVVNPLGEELDYSDDRLQGRRDQPKYLRLIRAVAFLRQMQKEVKTHLVEGQAVEYIEVDRNDVKLANKLAHEILGGSLDELSRPSRDLLLDLERMVKQRTTDKEQRTSSVSFTRREVREFTGWSNYRVHTHLRELIEFEYLAVEADRVTSGHRYRLLYDGQGKDGSNFVLGLRDPE